MTLADTATFGQTVLEVETVPASGTYVGLCGLQGFEVDRVSNTDEDEVADCDNEDLPLEVQTDVRSQQVKVTATGHWAAQSHQVVYNWWRNATRLNARIRNKKVETAAVSGETYAEQGPALLVNMKNERVKGKRYSSELEIVFDGVPAAVNNA